MKGVLESEVKDALIIGGGAAGFMAAIELKEALPDCRAVILEAHRNPLAKVRISGGGRCNVTHACYDPALLIASYPRGGPWLRRVLSRFGPAQTVVWFRDRGVTLVTEEDGRMFPESNTSETIVSLLIDAARRSGVELSTNVRVDGIEKAEDGFHVQAKETKYRARCVLIATGGGNARSYDLVRKLGHRLEPVVPSLFSLRTQVDTADLSGIALAVARVHLVSRPRFAQRGPLLFTHHGLSGPAILRLSAYEARAFAESQYNTDVVVCFAPDSTEADLRTNLARLRNEHGSALVRNRPGIAVPKRLWRFIADASNVPQDRRYADLRSIEVRALIDGCLSHRFKTRGRVPFKDEFVSCGGVSLKEVDPVTMESRISAGLYFAGEVLDVDGITGGFNFQHAWASGHLAGRAMAGKLQRNE